MRGTWLKNEFNTKVGKQTRMGGGRGGQFPEIQTEKKHSHRRGRERGGGHPRNERVVRETRMITRTVPHPANEFTQQRG